uniref:DNA-binding protein n=1 Tax=Rattus norvegicus TaxID=10116 RepID=Q63359_RAT|nr:DNA binding protein N5 [Rattus norvegicus]AAA67421.1 DNA-binding protein [Rattus norvegicus]|eukprot:NP_074048.1 DNA binding protein N5 [Rattus norvegicus]
MERAEEKCEHPCLHFLLRTFKGRQILSALLCHFSDSVCIPFSTDVSAARQLGRMFLLGLVLSDLLLRLAVVNVRLHLGTEWSSWIEGDHSEITEQINIISTS